MVARFDYSELIDDARNLLDEFGEDVTILRRVDTAGSGAAADWRPGAPTFTEYPTFAAFLPFSLQGRPTTEYRPGSDVPVGATIAYVPGDCFGALDDGTMRINLTDTIRRTSGAIMTISKVNEVAPGDGSAVLYELRVD